MAESPAISEENIRWLKEKGFNERDRKLLSEQGVTAETLTLKLANTVGSKLTRGGEKRLSTLAKELEESRKEDPLPVQESRDSMDTQSLSYTGLKEENNITREQPSLITGPESTHKNEAGSSNDQSDQQHSIGAMEGEDPPVVDEEPLQGQNERPGISNPEPSLPLAYPTQVSHDSMDMQSLITDATKKTKTGTDANQQPSVGAMGGQNPPVVSEEPQNQDEGPEINNREPQLPSLPRPVQESYDSVDIQSMIATNKANNKTGVVPVVGENQDAQNQAPVLSQAQSPQISNQAFPENQGTVLNQAQRPPTNQPPPDNQRLGSLPNPSDQNQGPQAREFPAASMQDPLSSSGLRQRPPHVGQNMPSLPRQPISQSGHNQPPDRSSDFGFREAPPQASIEDIISETGATTEDLNKRIQDDHLDSLASEFSNVNSLGQILRLKDQEIESIKKKHEDLMFQIREVLYTWRRKNGSRASYHRLAQVCLDHFRSADLATRICQLSKEEIHSCYGEDQTDNNGVSGGLTCILYKYRWIITIAVVVLLFLGGAWYISQKTGPENRPTPVNFESSTTDSTVIDHPHAREENNVKKEEVLYVYDQHLSGTIISPDSRPTMPELRSFKLRTGDSIDIVQKIAGESCRRRFGVLLLKDETEVNIIENDYHHAERIVDTIMGRWLSGRGKLPVTWQTLVSVIKEVHLDVLVQQIRGQFNQ